MTFKIVDTGLPMPEPDPDSDIRDEPTERDPFITVEADNYAFRWRCGSCGATDGGFITSEFAAQDGAVHSCLDRTESDAA